MAFKLEEYMQPYIGVFGLLILARRMTLPQVVQMSHLKCKKCGKEFDYKWIPLGSVLRYLKCPNCGKRTMFNIAETRVDPKKHRNQGELIVDHS